MTFKEFQHQYTENEVTFEYFCGFECDNQKYVKAQEDLFSQALADERRKFAEWLQENVIIDAESGVTVVAEVEYTRVISFIELLEMYEKEQKEGGESD